MTDFSNTPTVISVAVFHITTGDKMKKILIALSIALISYNPALAAFYGFGTDNACYVETYKRNSFWFCGKQEEKCTERKMGKKNNRLWQYHGESFSHDGKKYYCCYGTRTEKGYYVEASKWETYETITVQLANGTCTYQKITNACGEITDNPCTKPTDCTGNTIKRNGECIAPCGTNDGNMAYESATSNKCIECPTNASQGIINDSGTNPICVKCNSTTETWDADTKKCISRAEVTKKYHQISSATMKKCWQCPNNEIF